MEHASSPVTTELSLKAEEAARHVAAAAMRLEDIVTISVLGDSIAMAFAVLVAAAILQAPGQ